MAILDQLGLNQSILFQFIIFCVAYFSLTRLIFGPYAEALQKREQKTKGSEDLALEIHKKADELRARYETKAREISSSVKTVFDEYRNEANKEYEQIISRARAESAKMIESTRSRVNLEINDAQARIKAEVPVVAQEITRKLLTDRNIR
jgi:F-type H+-transporting ATPase subunit b